MYVQDAARLVTEAQTGGLVPDEHDPTLLAIGVLGAVAQFSHYHRTGRLKLSIEQVGHVRGAVDGPGAGRGPQLPPPPRAEPRLSCPSAGDGDVPCSGDISPQEDALNSSGPARRGWYRVPGEPGRLRWWDGARWTDDEFVLPGSEAESVDHHPTPRPTRPSLGTPDTAPDRVRALDSRAGRRPDSSAFAVLVPTAALLPVSLVALAAFWLVVRLVAPVPYWAFAVGYLAAGVLMFLRPVQRLLLSWLYGARRPTPEELDRLEPAWHDVVEQAVFRRTGSCWP